MGGCGIYPSALLTLALQTMRERRKQRASPDAQRPSLEGFVSTRLSGDSMYRGRIVSTVHK